MVTKRDMCGREDAGWDELVGVLEPLTPEQFEEPGYSPEGWSVKDLMAHIAAWQAEAGMVLQQIRNDTYAARPVDVDAMNREFHLASRDLPLWVVRAELWSARTRMLSAMNDLEEVTPEAEEWFLESGPEHYGEHLPRLRQWVRELSDLG
jgi:hypothetical protein